MGSVEQVRIGEDDRRLSGTFTIVSVRVEVVSRLGATVGFYLYC